MLSMGDFVTFNSKTSTAASEMEDHSPSRVTFAADVWTVKCESQASTVGRASDAKAYGGT
jgi:hypothetical protein